MITNVQLPYLQIKASLRGQKNPFKKPDGKQMKCRSLRGSGYHELVHTPLQRGHDSCFKCDIKVKLSKGLN